MALELRRALCKPNWVGRCAGNPRPLYCCAGCRTHEEWAAGHAPGAVHVPVAVNAAEGRQPNSDFVEQARPQGQAGERKPASIFCSAACPSRRYSRHTVGGSALPRGRRCRTQLMQCSLGSSASWRSAQATPTCPEPLGRPWQVKAAVPDPATPLCVACMGGARAESAAVQLAAAGYKNVKQVRAERRVGPAQLEELPTFVCLATRSCGCNERSLGAGGC